MGPVATKRTTTSRSSKLLTTQYAQGVVAGEPPACRKVILACERHLRDLKRQGTEGFPWVFDEAKGHRPIRFIEEYCRPSKGNFKRLVMLPWQHFVIGSLYGWVHKETGLRRFNEGLIFVGKKNGKSAIVSGLSLYAASKDGENGADIYILANSMKQARKTVYEECQKMVRASPALSKRFRVLRDGIYYDRANASIEPQATDSDKLDGLNVHLGLFDEIHEYKHYKLINIIRESTAARDQPLILYITTAGFVLDGPLMEFYERGSDVLEGVISDERTFYYMAELDEGDDLEDPSCWIKANPSLGVTIKREAMIEAWNSSKSIPEQRTHFITKRLNIFVQAAEQPFIPFEVLKRNSGHLDIETMKGRVCIGGFDLSDSEDFTSACLEFPLTDEDMVRIRDAQGNFHEVSIPGSVFVLSHSWIPENKVKADNEKLPFEEWEKEGLLTIVKGPYVTKEDVFDWFVKISEIYSVRLITYDPAKAYRLVQDLRNYGGDEWLQVVRQGALTLSPALKDVKEMLLAGRVVFNENRLLRWYINNVKLVDDRNGNWLPTKQGRYRKIDGFTAWLNAHTETMKIMATPPETGGVQFISVNDLLGKTG